MQTTNSHDPSREMARLMLMMRRLVKEEFTVTIHLDDPVARDELLAFASRSRNSLLRGLARELDAMAAPPLPGRAANEGPARRYRGAIPPAAPGSSTTASGNPAASPSLRVPTARPVRIYRGRTVA